MDDIFEGKKYNVLAMLPCPLKGSVEEAFNKFIKAENIEGDFLIESNANHNFNFNEYMDQIKNIEDMPDIIITAGINNFYGKDFLDKYTRKGYFAGSDDGYYSIICMNLLVMVVNLDRLGDRAVPESFADILKPEFENKVVIRGERGKFCETTLLAIYKDFGIEGIRNLGRSVAYGWHPSQMIKSIGINSKEGPIVSIMPYFYSNTIPQREKIKVIWPKEGAILSPVTMIVKKAEMDKVGKIAGFFMSEKIGEICTRANFPEFNDRAYNCLPDGEKINWIGWDFIDGNDIKSLVPELNERFTEVFNKTNL